MLKNYYWIFPGEIKSFVCEDIINLCKKQNLENAGVFDNQSYKGSDSFLKKEKFIPKNEKTDEELQKLNINKDQVYVRDSLISWINDQWLYDLIWPYLLCANEKAEWNFDIDFAENFQYTEYNEKGFYGWHQDGCMDNTNIIKSENPNLNNKIRKISMSLILNKSDEYENGDLKFDAGVHLSRRFLTDKKFRQQGTLIFFPSFVYHQVTPVTKGNRKSLVLWSVGPKFK